ncbi:hypothetical protein IMSHALPRED_008641 [Imshaugia aleurites]|uniref:Metallo-beta-lactamase domain-containing protein n=1 Tax=Imshaugia aleurites TaxID=172621 RepID=A0A8H3FYF0_9LECA|nr:hypothetical protein IMSHALPRED_008641 [Imshaugia aleurites]
MAGSPSLSEYFTCSRLNATTFVIHENDKYEEHPFIYVKIYSDPGLVVICDTGCGGGDAGREHYHNLKDYIETFPAAANDGKPLNPLEAERKYLIICTHCHYDHILGLKHFQPASKRILASSFDRSFIEENLPVHSLCKFLDVPTPEYTVSYWANDLEKLSFDQKSLNLQILHTPGHTPDELAWYDEQERHLYVGDSFYERVAKDKSYEQPIIFPKEGNWVHYMLSLEKLLRFVEEKNKEPGQAPVRIGCGHITSSVDGVEILLAVQQYFRDLIDGKVPIVYSEEKRGEEFVLWKAAGDSRFSVAAPKRLALEAAKS